MVTDELKNYISECLRVGKTKEEIARSLVEVGWAVSDFEEAWRVVLRANSSTVYKAKDGSVKVSNQSSRKLFLVYAALVSIIAILSGIVFFLWQDRLDLANTNAQKVRDFYTHLAESQISFTDAGEMVFPDEQKFLTQKQEYILNKENFVEVNLRAMRLILYENGVPVKEMKVMTKGREGSWWETPTGNYKVLGKSVNLFSSIGKVWMPYSVQFYGNYFIHGWPYYDDGTPVASTYSGGCVRLADEDAKDFFDFVEKGMPVLVLEDRETEHFGLLKPKVENANLPAISAKAFLITDLASGEMILEKNANMKLPIASLTKLVTAVVAHESIYLGRPIKVTSEAIGVAPQTLANTHSVFQISVGDYYRGFDLLYLLLMQSSNEAAKTLASFLGEKTFVRSMNEKVKSIGMDDTIFADASGISADDVSTAADISKLLQYIYYKCSFLFDISKGKEFGSVGLIKIGDTVNISDLKNFNEFSDRQDLIGMKNGETSMAKQTMATVWNFQTLQGDVPIGIIVLGSQDRVRDTENLLRWLKDNFE